MEQSTKELTPVSYNEAGIKVLHFEHGRNRVCFPAHWHDRVEMILVKEGKMYVGYGKNTFQVSAGELMIFPPKTPHKGFTTNQSVNYDVLMFDIRSFYNDTGICKHYLPSIYDGRARFQNIITTEETIHCFDYITHLSSYAPFEITTEMYRLVFLLFQHDLVELKDEISRDDTIMEIITYIENHFEQELSTSSISAYFNYSSEHLCRKFKRATGLTPMNYLKIYRMEMARKIIKNENCNIKELAYRCGFDDANYFTRCFKSHFGVAPTKYFLG